MENTTTEVPRVTLEEVKQKMDTGQPLFFIDIRSSKDWDRSNVKLPGAVRVRLRELEQRVGEFPEDRPIMTYCT